MQYNNTEEVTSEKETRLAKTGDKWEIKYDALYSWEVSEKFSLNFSSFANLFSFGGLFLHIRPCDDILENSCFQIFTSSRVHEGIIFGWIKEQFSRDSHVVYNRKTNRPS